MAEVRASLNTPEGLTSQELKMVVFTDTVLDLFKHAIEGKQERDDDPLPNTYSGCSIFPVILSLPQPTI